MHPFLTNDFHIRWSTLTPDHIEADINKALEEAKLAVDTVAKQAEPLSYENTIAALDDGLETLNHAWGLVSHLDSVSNSPELRKAYNAMLPAVTEFFSGIPLNDALWQTIKAFGESDTVEDLSAVKRRYVEETMADFLEQGADLPAEKKKRAAELQNRLANITQKYSENCLDAVNAWEKIVTDEALLSGLPDSALSAAKQNAEKKGHENAWRFTLQAPSYIAVMTYADSDALRREVWQAYAAVGRGEAHNNRELVREILDLRQEFAELLGEKNFADHATKRRMAKSGDKALEFTDELFEKCRSQFQDEATQLRIFKHSTFNVQPSTSNVESPAKPPLLEPWEASYWAEKQRKAKFDFDEEALRPYFPINKVIGGMFDLAQELFGLRIEERGARCGIGDTSDGIRDTGCGIRDTGCEMRDDGNSSGSQIADPVSHISNHGSRHSDPESHIPDPKSQISDLGSRIPNPTSLDAVDTWHEEVKFYDLLDAESNEQLGSFYADWHPRESKRGGAWMNFFITGNRDASKGKRTPHLGLICGNLTSSVGDKPALLTHREVETIFHEFGHLLHHLCGEVEVKSLNGVNVPWDFVELPSQLMENWCWERVSLDRFARHYESDAPIPEDLFNKMLAARNYMKATSNVGQLGHGKMDLELHINWSNSDKADLDSFIEKALEGYKAEYKTKPTSNVFNFSHLFSSPTGYAAGYYSYKWAEVLDADAFTRFQKEGLMNPATGRDFRTKILAKGNSAEPAKLYKDFMGREPDPEALLRRDGLIA